MCYSLGKGHERRQDLELAMHWRLVFCLIVPSRRTADMQRHCL